jgi:hypothetical protein
MGSFVTEFRLQFCEFAGRIIDVYIQQCSNLLKGGLLEETKTRNKDGVELHCRGQIDGEAVSLHEGHA